MSEPGSTELTETDGKIPRGFDQFSEETEAFLLANGYKIFTVKSISKEKLIDILKKREKEADSKRRSGYYHWSGFPGYINQDLAFDDVNPNAQFAVNLSALRIENSNQKTYEDQKKLVDELNSKLLEGVPDVKAIIGSASLYCYLDLIYQDATGQILLDDFFAVTSTPTKSGAGVAVVGRNYVSRFIVATQNKRDRSKSLFVVPIIVPERSSLFQTRKMLPDNPTRATD